MRDDNLIYVAGNGRICGAFRDGDLLQAFGPPYSSGTIFFSSHKVFPGNKEAQNASGYAGNNGECASASIPERIGRASIWKYNFAGGVNVTDMAVGTRPVLLRNVEIEPGNIAEFTLHADKKRIDWVQPLRNYREIAGNCREITGNKWEITGKIREIPENAAFLVKTHDGVPVYNDYPLLFPQYFVVYSPDWPIEYDPETLTWTVRVEGNSGKYCPQEARLMIIGGPDYPDVIRNFAQARELTREMALAETQEYWREIFAETTLPDSLPGNIPEREILSEVIISGIVEIISQQGEEGGVLAGHNFHLAYVRDQFGVSEGLMALGLYSRARKILEFYGETFRKYGKILNAQGIGAPGVFHYAECDESEIPGYLLLQFFRYVDATGDETVLTDNEELLDWLFLRQLSVLKNGTMPFNGDETYIACGLLPRDAVSDASAEATILFMESAGKLAEYREKQGNIGESCLIRALIGNSREIFPEKFISRGKYYINCPDGDVAHFPDFRYGVCMNCGAFGWSGLTGERSYLCPACLARNISREKTDERYSLPSSLLGPALYGGEIPGAENAVKERVRELTRTLRETGHAYSLPGALRNIGYDFGVLLLNILNQGKDRPGGQGAEGTGRLPDDPEACADAELVYRKILELRDGIYMYPETFTEDRPTGTRCRPWETGVNIAALVRYVEARYGEK